MQLDNFDLSKDDTKLVKSNDTVYKVKVLPQRLFESELPCSILEANRQIEEVFRAVLYMDQRTVIFKPIYTKDFIITTKKKNWKTSQKLSFQIYGKPLKACPYQFILKVNLKNNSFTKNDQSEIHRNVQLKTNTTKQSDDYTIDETVVSHDTKRKSCDRPGDTTLRKHSMRDDISNSDRTNENNVKESRDKERNHLEIVDSYKNVKNFKDLTDSSGYDKLPDDLNSEKRKNILLEKIRERERKKKEELRKKQELEKIFTDFQSVSAPRKMRKLYKADVYCKTPGSIDAKVYNTRSSRKSNNNVQKPNGDETERSIIAENAKNVETRARSKTSSPSCEIRKSDENESRPINNLENIGSTSTPRTLRSRNRRESNMLQSDKYNTEQQTGHPSGRTRRSGKILSGKIKTGLPSSGRESARLQNKKVLSDVKDKNKELSSYQDSYSSTSSQSEEQLTAATKIYPTRSRAEEHLTAAAKIYPIRSRAKSLSPYGNKITKRARYVNNSSYDKNNSAKKSPKIDLFRPYQSFGNESGRLENLRTTSLNQKNQLVSRKQIDRHEVEKEEIVESMKLQKMSKSLSPQISPQGTRRKRKSSGFWNLVDSLLMPVKRVLKG